MCLKGVLFRSPYFYAIKIVKKDLILDKVVKEYISKYNSLDNPIFKDVVQDEKNKKLIHLCVNQEIGKLLGFLVRSFEYQEKYYQTTKTNYVELIHGDASTKCYFKIKIIILLFCL